MRGEFAPAPDASTLAAEVTQLASAAPATSKQPITAQGPTAPATVNRASVGAATLSNRPLASTTAHDDAKARSSSARGPEPTSSASPVLRSEGTAGGPKLSVMPDRGGRSDLIAAARRAAQATSGGAASGHGACAPELALRTPASGIGRLHALIGATAAVLIVLGLIQTLVSPADETTLITPSNTTLSPDTLPALGPGLARVSVPAIAASTASPFLSTSMPEPEATGKVRLLPAATNGTAAATAASTIPIAPRLPWAAATSILPRRVLHNKKCVRAWRVRRTSVECARLSAESRAYFAGIPPAMPSR